MKIGHNHAQCGELERLIAREAYSTDAALGWLSLHGKPGIVTICTRMLCRYIGCEMFAGIGNRNLPVKGEVKEHQRQARRKACNNLKGRSIESRPQRVETRIEEDRREKDCVVGKPGRKARLLVLTERATRQEMIFKMSHKAQDCVAEVLDRLGN